jgi:predicted nucleotidyltransferase
VLARRLAELGAERVILFGSSCDGRRTAVDSDLDLVVVMPGVEGIRFHQRLQGWEALDGLPFPVDLLVYTPEEWERVRRRWFFRHEVLGKGVILFERAR